MMMFAAARTMEAIKPYDRGTPRGSKTFLIGGAIVVTAWPIFALVHTGQLWGILAGVTIFLALGHAMVYAPAAGPYCETFPTAVRYSGISIGYQMASILLASFTPALASAMVLWAGG